MKQLIFLLAMATIGFSFTTIGNEKGKKTKKVKKEKIIYKLKKNLYHGWRVLSVQDSTKFSQTMLDLGIDYGINLSHPTEANSQNTEVNVLVSKKNQQYEMVDFIRQKAVGKGVKYHFILSRQYLLTFIWSERTDTQENKRFREKLFKQMDWYFEMY